MLLCLFNKEEVIYFLILILSFTKLSVCQLVSVLYMFCSPGAKPLQEASFGNGTGPVFLGGVRCTGHERSLLACQNMMNPTNCSSRLPAAVRCLPGTGREKILVEILFPRTKDDSRAVLVYYTRRPIQFAVCNINLFSTTLIIISGWVCVIQIVDRIVVCIIQKSLS